MPKEIFAYRKFAFSINTTSDYCLFGTEARHQDKRKAPTHSFVRFFETNIFNPYHEYIMAGDETVVSKSEKESFGIGRFFSGLRGKVIRGLSFFVFSLVDTVERKSYPLSVNQRVKSEAEKAALKNRKKKRAKHVKGAKGRPLGSLNRNKNELKLSAELLQINEWLVLLLKLARCFMTVRYLALDEHFGHHQAVRDGAGKRFTSDFQTAERCGFV